MMETPTHVPFADYLGLLLLRMAGGEAEITVNLRPELLNTWQVAHGGVTMTLLDVTMAHAARSLNMRGQDKGPGVVTVEMKPPSCGRVRATSGAWPVCFTAAAPWPTPKAPSTHHPVSCVRMPRVLSNTSVRCPPPAGCAFCLERTAKNDPHEHPDPPGVPPAG